MSDATDTSGDKPQDLKSRLKQFAQPLVDSLDTRLREQVDSRVDERVDAALSARLAVIERAIADLDRAVRALEERIEPPSD
ncbi:MAG TPA: hypothetical protein VMV96_03755 [Acidimicrobiales bacterium]|nr:hypothetical protein [Acidimicrobiales bacterium]